MLTREIALERLRTVGTLATGKPDEHQVKKEATNSRPARALAQLVNANYLDHGQRYVAAAHHHAVLP